MKFSLTWLKRHLNTTHTAEELAEAMVKLGLEVEGLEFEGEAFNNVVVGYIESREQHPDADKLGVCQVNVGESETKQIVCGAPNARAGLTVAVALEGAVLPGNFEIKPTKLRGVKSNGMICSVRELAMGDEHNGIWEMETEAKVGTPLAEALGLDDVVFDLSVTPNRGDALSVYGVARDLAAAGMGQLIEPSATRKTVAENQGGIHIQRTHEGCPFFTGQYIEGVKNAQSPQWVKKFLEQAGLRPINAVADMTNFMLLSYGQPMHAYDADKLKGDMRIEPAKGGETLVGLDGNTHTLAEGDIAICDDSGVIGLAGIVGGESTSVDENTKNVYLEVARFNKHNIAVTGQRLQCNTDARYRFERGIDPAMTAPTAMIAANMITEICGGEAKSYAANGAEQPEQRVIQFNPEKVKTFGGLDIPQTEIKQILQNLGFSIKDGNVWAVTVPSHFTIMDTEADLVEEVLRLKGFDAVPTVLPPLPEVKITGADKGRVADRVGRRALAAMGYLECINYSFMNREKAKMFAEGANLLELDNPLDEEGMSTMRPSLVPSLLEAARKNISRGESYIRLGEVGKTYTETNENRKAAGLIIGTPEKHWLGQNRTADIFTAKADALTILEALGLNAEKLQVYADAGEGYHPGRSGKLALGKNIFAKFGEVHPAYMKKFDLKGTAIIFEVDLELAESMRMKTGAFVQSNYQASSRDFAFLVDETVPALDLVNALKGADKELVKHVNLFDMYQGEHVPEGKKSVALSMTLQATDRTLTEAEINAVAEKAIANVKKRFDAEVR